jgi:hypothetical protein
MGPIHTIPKCWVQLESGCCLDWSIIFFFLKRPAAS